MCLGLFARFHFGYGAANRLMRAGAIQGLVFHCTPLVKRGLAAVEVSRRWIAEHAVLHWGS